VTVLWVLGSIFAALFTLYYLLAVGLAERGVARWFTAIVPLLLAEAIFFLALAAGWRP
jgi:hypothetical protein